MSTLTDRLSHPWLAGMALAGAGWWLIGLGLTIFGPDVFRPTSVLIHVLGLAAIVLSGVIFGVMWWAKYLRAKFDW